MGLTRREFLWAIPLSAAMVLGCGGSATRAVGPSQLLVLSIAQPQKADAKTILICMPETAQTRDVWKGLSDELSREYRLVAIRVERGTDAEVIAEGIKRFQPVGMVLMNNPTVAAYRAYQRNTTQQNFPPSVIVMTSFLEGQSGRLIGATGVTYEVPLITVMTNLRRLIALKSERVGVVVRAPMRAFVAKQLELAAREQIVVIQEVVSARPNPSELKRAIRLLKQRADVLWILNDDRLLNPKLIAEAWLPGLDERPWIPTIVGAGSLVSSQRSFGTFAVLPDHVALGAQAASLLLDLAESDWKLDRETSIQLPLSTTTIMDLAQVKERFVMQKDALQQVDKILE